MAERVIGIDFGTSTSVVRIKRYENGKPLDGALETRSLIFNGTYPTVPTVIQCVGENRYYGYDALVKKSKQAVLHQGFKVHLESEVPSLREEARALTREFFRYLYKVYREQSNGGFLGNEGDKTRTYISYPVKWSQESKEFMIQAAAQAGFPQVAGIDEAQAAIHAVTLQCGPYLRQQGYMRTGVPCIMLLMDMGAGTTDLALCRHTWGPQATTEILSTWPTTGETLFGGQEMEGILRGYVAGKVPPQAQSVLDKCGLEKFKSWKEALVAPALAHGDPVEGFSDLDILVEACGYEVEPYRLDRAALEGCAASYLKQLPQLVQGCIRAAGIQPNQIDLVLLTGGHSQWYFIPEILSGKKPEICGCLLPQIAGDEKRILSVPRPQETVALGLAYRPMRLVFKQREAMPQQSEPQTAQQASAPARPVQHTPKAASRTDAKPSQKPQGVSAAQGEVEDWFQHGSELTKAGQHAEAARWYQLAGQAGHAQAQYCLGSYYDRIQDYPKAVEWLRRSAELGYPEAEYSYAMLLCRGAGVEIDYITAADWCRRAADHGVEAAQNRLSQFCVMAEVSRDQQRAERKGDVLSRLPVWVEQFVQSNGRIKKKEEDFKEDTLLTLRERLGVPADLQVFLAHDDTLFHSGKNGYCLTPDGIYCRELMEKPHVVRWRALLYYQIDEAQQIELFTQKGPRKVKLFYHTIGGTERRAEVLLFFQKLQQHLRSRVKKMAEE